MRKPVRYRSGYERPFDGTINRKLAADLTDPRRAQEVATDQQLEVGRGLRFDSGLQYSSDGLVAPRHAKRSRATEKRHRSRRHETVVRQPAESRIPSVELIGDCSAVAPVRIPEFGRRVFSGSQVQRIF